MKRIVLSIMFCFISLSLLVDSANAEGNQQKIPESKIDNKLRKAGTPEHLISSWDYSKKLDIYNAGEITYDTTNVVGDFSSNTEGNISTDGFGTMATIPPSELALSHDVYTVNSSGTIYKRVYANYQWSSVQRGTKGDKIGIAIPNGWEIRAGAYACGELQGSSTSSWILKGNCNGGTYDLDYYGAVWSLTRTDFVFHKGWVRLDMKRVNSSAQLKVNGKYVEDISGSTSWGISWGPLSVNISGNKASDQRAWDTEFTY